jgi:hypothetical protein
MSSLVIISSDVSLALANAMLLQQGGPRAFVPVHYSCASAWGGILTSGYLQCLEFASCLLLNLLSIANPRLL